MKITKTQLTDLIRDELENFKIVKLTADDMEQLHKSGQIEKDGVFYQYQEPVKEGFDLKKLEDAIKMFQKKIKKQGRVTNARDEEHLKQLIKVYKNMGGKRIKESVWGLPKGSNTTNMDELDAELSRAGIKSIPDFTKLIVQVKGNKSKINKIMKTHKAKKIFEGKRQQLSIPVMDKLKTDKILKKLRLKPGKDYDVGVGSRNSFILDIEGKHLDKLITLLMKQRIRVR